MRHDLVQHLYRQRAFSRGTFGPGDRTKGLCDHISKELVEVEKAFARAEKEHVEALADYGPTDEWKPELSEYLESEALPEWIDLVILAFDGALRTGASPEAIVAALLKKQETNEGRNWPDWRTAPKDKAIEHVREAAE